MLWTKKAHQSTFYQTFECLFECFNENSPNFACHFWNHQVRVYWNFASLFSVIKDNSSVFLYLKPCILWRKRAHRKKTFRHLIGWVKISQISHVIFEITSHFLFNLCITLQCHESQLFCTLLAESLYDLEKRNRSKCKISDFQLLAWNFTRFVHS